MRFGTVLALIFRVLGVTVPTALVGTLMLAGNANASTLQAASSTSSTAVAAQVQCQLPLAGPNRLVPFIGEVGGGPRYIKNCQIHVYLTNDGPVIQVTSPLRAGKSPMYHLNAIARPGAAHLDKRPIPTKNVKTMQCSIVERNLVPGFVARWPHVRCGVQFRQRIPVYLGSALELTYGQLVKFYSIKGILAHAATKIPVRVFP